jgi:hypothetical protein
VGVVPNQRAKQRKQKLKVCKRNGETDKANQEESMHACYGNGARKGCGWSLREATHFLESIRAI